MRKCTTTYSSQSSSHLSQIDLLRQYRSGSNRPATKTVQHTSQSNKLCRWSTNQRDTFVRKLPFSRVFAVFAGGGVFQTRLGENVIQVGQAWHLLARLVAMATTIAATWVCSVLPQTKVRRSPVA